MQNVGFNEEEIDQIIDVLVGVLNLGNIEFDEVHKKGVGPCSQLSAKSLQFAKNFGQYTGLKGPDEVEQLLTVKTKDMFGEALQINLA
jgi:hypothetical protein